MSLFTGRVLGLTPEGSIARNTAREYGETETLEIPPHQGESSLKPERVLDRPDTTLPQRAGMQIAR